MSSFSQKKIKKVFQPRKHKASRLEKNNRTSTSSQVKPDQTKTKPNPSPSTKLNLTRLYHFPNIAKVFLSQKAIISLILTPECFVCAHTRSRVRTHEGEFLLHPNYKKIHYHSPQKKHLDTTRIIGPFHGHLIARNRCNQARRFDPSLLDEFHTENATAISAG